MEPFERFEAWQAAHAMALEIHRATSRWPIDERYGLVAQLRRAAFSVAANIAEGSARRGPREFRRFLDNALGSSAEIAYTLRLARDLGMIAPDDFQALDEIRQRAGQLLWGLYRAIAARAH